MSKELNGTIGTDLDDLNDMAKMLTAISSASIIDTWITAWRDRNAKVSGKDDKWHDCFPSVNGITISSDIVDGMLQIWVEKNFFVNGRVIRIGQQVF